jgi:hypothetical protein
VDVSMHAFLMFISKRKASSRDGSGNIAVESPVLQKNKASGFPRRVRPESTPSVEADVPTRELGNEKKVPCQGMRRGFAGSAETR